MSGKRSLFETEGHDFTAVRFSGGCETGCPLVELQDQVVETTVASSVLWMTHQSWHGDVRAREEDTTFDDVLEANGCSERSLPEELYVAETACWTMCRRGSLDQPDMETELLEN